MSSIERYGSAPPLRPRDARALDRLTSTVHGSTASALVVIDAAGQRWEEVLRINTDLTGQIMRDAVQVAQAEAIGSEMAPNAAHRLAYIADQHAMQESQILARAHQALGRLAQ